MKIGRNRKIILLLTLNYVINVLFAYIFTVVRIVITGIMDDEGLIFKGVEDWARATKDSCVDA